MTTSLTISLTAMTTTLRVSAYCLRVLTFTDHLPTLFTYNMHPKLFREKSVYYIPDFYSITVTAAVATTTWRSTNSSNILEQLHWLPIEWRIMFKISCITYKTVSTTQPAYLHSLLKHYVPSRTLRSSGSNLLLVSRVRTGFWSRSFSVAAPIIWNSLPFDIRSSSTISCFRRQLKTFFYKAAFRPP